MNYYVICWEKYADFSGRARREEYWMFSLINTIVLIILFFIGVLANPNDGIGEFNFLYGLFYLSIIIPKIAVTVRRLHDTNNSGWMSLISLIPIIGWIWIIVLLVTEGDAKKNKYGKNPKQLTNEQKTSVAEEEILRETDTIIEENGIKSSQSQILNKIELLEKSFKLGLITEAELNSKKVLLGIELNKEKEVQFKLRLTEMISEDIDLLNKLKNKGLLTQLEYAEKVKDLYERKKSELETEIRDKSTEDYTYEEYLRDIRKD